MDIVLKVTPEQLTSMANDITSQVNEIQKKFAEIETAISKSRGYWEGEASDKHQKKFDKQKDSISTIINNLELHPEKLLQLAEIYTETESKITEVAASLPTEFF